MPEEQIASALIRSLALKAVLGRMFADPHQCFGDHLRTYVVVLK